MNSDAQPAVSRRLLVIEQDLERRQQLYSLLLRLGHPVQTVASGRQAMNALQHEWPLLIVMGDAFPDITGRALIKRLRALDGDVPIILLSSGSAPAAEADAAVNIHAILALDAPEEVLLREAQRCLAIPRHGHPAHLPCRVLIVDDEPKLCALLKDFLELHGFAAETAASGEAALAKISQQVPNFVLLDIGMDGMDGLVTLKKIKALPTPTTVIMVTGNPESDTVKQAMALGAQDYIQKPFSPEYLEAVLLSTLATGPTHRPLTT